MYQRDKKDIRKIFKDANSLGFELGYDLNSLVNNHYANTVSVWTISTSSRNFSKATTQAGLHA